MPKRVISGPDIPPTRLPFSPLVEANGFVFLAGQVGGVAGSHEAVPGGIEAETRQTLENIGQLLRAAGLDYANVVQATVYLLDFTEFERMNGVYREFFPVEPPARVTVEVARLAYEYRIEIVVVAAR